MKKALFLAITALLLTGCFARCSTNPHTANLVKPTNKNIQSIHISYHDWEKLAYLEELEKGSSEYLVYEYLRSDEYYDSFIEIEADARYWDVIMEELTKRRKKVGPFTPKRNPGPHIGSITITYNDGKETKVNLARYNYFTINSVYYYYGHGPNFDFIEVIIQEQKGL